MPSDEQDFPREIAGYALEEKLARGRAGLVFRGRDPEGKHVAVRTFGGRLEPLAPKAHERLEDVYKRLEQVMHASVPKVLDQGDHEGRPYVVLQHASGERLDKILEDQRLGVDQVLGLGKTLADALTAAHTVGLVHTDVCARCVVVGKDPVHMLLGWSAARPLGGPLGKDVPRASLRPPDGEAPDALATPQLDVFGLGALLYEALAYAPPRPYDPAAPAALRAAWPLRRLNPTLSLAVETVIAKAIDPDPSVRYVSAADFAADLAALVDKRPPQALKGRRGRALVRAARRRPVAFTVVGLAVSIALGVVAAALGSTTARRKRLASEVEAVKTALAKGSVDRAESELARAREDDPAHPLVLEAASLVETARLEAARNAQEGERDARVAEAESEGKAALERARRRRGTFPALEERVRRAAARAEPLASPDGPEKRSLEAARAALDEAAREEARSLGEAVSALRRALALAPDRGATIALLVEVELERCAGLDAPREIERGLRAFGQAAATALEGSARPARLVVSATPKAATATIARADGGPARELALPAELELPAGFAQLSFKAPGLPPQDVIVHLEPARTSRVKVALVASTPGDDVIVPGLELELPPAPLPLAGTDVERATSALVRAAAPPVSVPPTFVARALVTCRDFAAFLREKGGDLPADRDGKPLHADLDALERAGNAPVTGVTLEQARAYARAKARRLPTRGELWAARARGAAGELREWTLGAEGPLVLDLRGDREVVGDERAATASLRSKDLGFRLAESAR